MQHMVKKIYLGKDIEIPKLATKSYRYYKKKVRLTRAKELVRSAESVERSNFGLLAREVSVRLAIITEKMVVVM